MAKVYKNVSTKLAHMKGVREAIDSKGQEIASQARANLAPHDNPGGAEIQLYTSGTDAVIALVDTDDAPAAAAIEYGHTAPNGTHVEGLWVIHDAAGLAH